MMLNHTEIQFLRDKITILLTYLPRGDADLSTMLRALDAMGESATKRELGYFDAEIDRQVSYHRYMTPEFGKTGLRAFHSMLRVKYGRRRVRENPRLIAIHVLKQGFIQNEHEARSVLAYLSGDFQDRGVLDSAVVEKYQAMLSRYEQRNPTSKS